MSAIWQCDNAILSKELLASRWLAARAARPTGGTFNFRNALFFPFCPISLSSS